MRRAKRALRCSAGVGMLMSAAAAQAQISPASGPPTPTDSAAAAKPIGQEAALNTPDAQDGSTANQIADIVVTAQRRSENLQRVPIAITVASGQALASAAIVNTLQLSAIAPGLNIRTNNGSFNPFIRGIGTSSNVVENPVALVIDGVYYPQQRDGIRELLDIDQVAVLKGPQGTLFGRNATGGVIQITTKAPSDTFGGNVGVELDNYLTLKTKAYLTGPLADNLSFSLSGLYGKQFDGYGENFTTGHDTYQLRKQIEVRGKLRYEPRDGTSILLIADYADRDSLTSSFQPYPGTRPFLPGFGPVTSRYDTYSGVDPFVAYRGGGISGQIEQDLGFAKLVSITAYRQGHADTLIQPTNDPAASFRVASDAYNNHMFSQEVQLVSKPGRFTYTLGVYYFDYVNEVEPIRVSFGPLLTPSPFAPSEIDTYGRDHSVSVAPFGQASWELLPGTTLTGGVRWTYEKRTGVLAQTVALAGGFPVPPFAANPSVTFKEPTFRAALSHQFGPRLLVYASYNTGFKSGGFNIEGATNPAYLPEKLKAYETGFKSQLLDNRLRLNAAAYYYDYTNIQVPRFFQGVQTIVNGAAAKLYGLDVDIEASLATGLRLSGGLALEHSEFTDFPNAVFAVAQPNNSFVLGVGNAKGNRLPLAQKIAGTASLDYEHALGQGTVNTDVTANYSGDYFFDPDNGLLRQRPYVLLNSTIRYTLPGGRVSLSVFGKNLFDKAILSFPVTIEYGANASYAPPRTFGGAVSYKF